MVCAFYAGSPHHALAQSGDGPFAGFVVDEFSDLYGPTADVIVTTACLQGNPFVPEDPPIQGPTLSGCKLDIPGGGGTADGDNNQLITVLPSNFLDGTSLTRVSTYGSGSNTGLEFGVTVRAVSKDIYLGLANPGLFADPPVPVEGSAVAETADVFCTSVDDSFDCAQIEPCSTCTSAPPNCGELDIEPDQSDFCTALTGLLAPSYNVVRNPLAYAVSTNMSILAQPGSATLRLCPGFQAQCLPPSASPVASNVRVTTVHTQSPAVETPRTFRYAYP